MKPETYEELFARFEELQDEKLRLEAEIESDDKTKVELEAEIESLRGDNSDLEGQITELNETIVGYRIVIRDLLEDV